MTGNIDLRQLKKKYQHEDVVEYTNQAGENPLVSVCVQTYQHKLYIKECLDGILMQKVDFPYEILLGEDASTDGTREICLEYAKRYPDKIRLFLHHRDNNIRVNGRPTGRFSFMYNLFSAKGNYIALCPGDDYWTNQYKLQKQVDFLENDEEYAICFHNMLVKYEDNPLDNHYSHQNNQAETSTILDLAKGNFIYTASCIFKKGLFRDLPNWFLKIPVGDYPLHLLNAQFGNIKYFNECMGVYRVHKGGIWENRSEIERFERWVAVLNVLIGKFPKPVNQILREKRTDYYHAISKFYDRKNDRRKARIYAIKFLYAFFWGGLKKYKKSEIKRLVKRIIGN